MTSIPVEINDWYQFGVLCLAFVLVGTLWAVTLWILKRNTDGFKSLSKSVDELTAYIHHSELKYERRFGLLESQIKLQIQSCRDHIKQGVCPPDCPMAKDEEE